MTVRTYMISPQLPGQKGLQIDTIVSANDHDHMTAVLHLPEGTAGSTAFDIVQVLKRAYEDGREDRQAELLDDQDAPLERYRGVLVPERLRTCWRSQAASYWRAGVEAAYEATREI